MTESHRSRPDPHPVQVRPITPADFDHVADMLGRAFDDDPFANFIVKQDNRRSERVRRDMYRVLTKWTHPYGETYVTEGFKGAALWNPPNGRPHGLWTDLRMLSDTARNSGLRKLLPLMSAFNQLEKQHPQEPHYYLAVIGVDPSFQGRRIGSQLMTPVLERADREGMPAYLESSKDVNIPLYERHGFRVTGEVQMGRNGPTLWPMWRDPQ